MESSLLYRSLFYTHFVSEIGSVTQNKVEHLDSRIVLSIDYVEKSREEFGKIRLSSGQESERIGISSTADRLERKSIRDSLTQF